MAKKPTKPTAKPSTPTYPLNPALEAAVIANAEDDTPRLVYADWLDENGDPDRAAFIRTQVALWDKNPADEDYVDLIERREELDSQVLNTVARERLYPRLNSDLVEFGHNAYGQPDEAGTPFHRGFPYFAREPHPTSERTDLESARLFRDALPEMIRSTTLRGLIAEYTLHGHLNTALDTPAAEHLTAFSLGRYDSPALQHVLNSPARKSIRWLHVGQLTQSDAKALAQSEPKLFRFDGIPTFGGPTLKKLFVSGTFARLHRANVTLQEENAAAAISQFAQLPELHTLELSGGTGVCPQLAKAKGFASLGRLRIPGVVGPSDSDLIIELSRAKLPKLASLEYGLTVRDEGILALVNSAMFGNIRELNLHSAELGDKGVIALATSPAARGLRALWLSSPFRKAGLDALSAADALPNLTSLSFYTKSTVRNKSRASEADFASFIQRLAAPLRHLNLESWPVGDAGAVAVAQNPAFANLCWLKMGSSGIGKKGLRAMADSPRLKTIVFLWLAHNPCVKSAELLCDPAIFPCLAECWLSGITDKLKASLAAARPNVAWH